MPLAERNLQFPLNLGLSGLFFICAITIYRVPVFGNFV